jgi:hypothetical protein
MSSGGKKVESGEASDSRPAPAASVSAGRKNKAEVDVEELQRQLAKSRDELAQSKQRLVESEQALSQSKDELAVSKAKVEEMAMAAESLSQSSTPSTSSSSSPLKDRRNSSSASSSSTASTDVIMQRAGLSKMPPTKPLMNPLMSECASEFHHVMFMMVLCHIQCSESEMPFTAASGTKGSGAAPRRPVKVSSQLLHESDTESVINRVTVYNGFSQFSTKFREVSKKHDLCFNFQEKSEVRGLGCLCGT